MRSRLPAVLVSPIAVIVVIAGLSPWRRADDVPVFAAPRDVRDVEPGASGFGSLRADALRRARVWSPVDPALISLDRNPPDAVGTLSTQVVPCRFQPKEADGTTPKFRCVLPDGEVVKIKYGSTGELPAELAATRLLAALGFPADRMYRVARLRCYGCPRFPFQTEWVLDRLHAMDLASWLPATRYTDFESVVAERRHDAAEIADDTHEGWAWYELNQIDPSVGASRAEVDALRLLAAFIAHWDNKASNQRLACADRDLQPGRCEHPIAFIQDLGSTFGPRKPDLESWRETPVWADAASCRLSMKSLPYGGATFPDVVIGDEGRQLLLRQLRAIPGGQVLGLFRSSGFDGRDGHDAAEWAALFWQKVDAIETAGPCPGTSNAPHVAITGQA